MEAPERMYCATHPSVETVLRCGKCEKPICPRCLVYTPVGTRCRDCAQLRRLPIFTVSPSRYAAAVGAGAAAALVVGTLWGALATLIGGYLYLLLAAGGGYAAGEIVSLAANRKRSLGLQVIAGGSALLAYVVSQVALVLIASLLNGGPGLALHPVELIALGLRVSLQSLGNVMTLIAVALAMFLAVSRFR